MRRISEKLYSWASLVDGKTLEQAERTATMPFVSPHLALMPDCHLGAGATVGSVIPTVAAIIPAAVGVDIGCGMIAARTQLTVHRLPSTRARLRTDIERRIPLSAGRYNKVVADQHTATLIGDLEAKARRHQILPDSYAPNWRLQLGTLGSGNHFIEVSADEDGRVWLFLHSGSRGVGNKIAQHHIRVAQRVCEKNRIQLPDRDLAYLSEGTDEFHAYIRDLRWAQDFALLNRREMMHRVQQAVQVWTGSPIEVDEEVNCHHNYTERETHFGQRVWLSRKGAIDASVGRPGLIPGSMGTRSYVVEGRGHPMSFNSAPHGAGRQYSRSAARRTFTRDQLREAMTGIEYRETSAFLDEIPAAYKPIEVVMRDSADLVKVRHELRQLVNVKGD
ncbi:MAG TPA: RtcB family protein [Propionibacteriaceae bacterium]|nr:RtcB family protein [Propionibacteriaceae bacterium]